MNMHKNHRTYNKELSYHENTHNHLHTHGSTFSSMDFKISLAEYTQCFSKHGSSKNKEYRL